MLRMLLTFDYELFFNDSYYTEKEVLIDTSEIIMKGLNKAGVKGTFFVDTPCIERYEELGLHDFPHMVKKQVNELLNNNHDIQLHLHPSWNTAEYNGKEWSFKQEDYSLDKHANPSELIIKAKNTLDALAGDNSNYRCCAYRAGGFCLTPEKEVLSTLYKIGIRIDSSVCCGVRMESIAQSFDWREMPDKVQWGFRPKYGVRNKNDGYQDYMYEIPIGTYSQIPGKWILTHAQPKLNYPEPKGQPSPVESIRQVSVLKQLSDRIRATLTTPVIFSMDTLHANALYRIAEFFVHESRKRNQDVYICAIAHPKFSSKKCVYNMISFIKKVKESFDSEIDFISFRDAYNTLFEK